LDRTDRSQRSRWTGPIGPGNTPGPSRTDKIGSTRLGPKSVGLGRSRSGPDRGCPYLDDRGTVHGTDWSRNIYFSILMECMGNGILIDDEKFGGFGGSGIIYYRFH